MTALGQTLGFMRNLSHQRPGKAIPLGERPPGRPMADALPGATKLRFSTSSNIAAHARFDQPESPGLALRKFSWEVRA